MKKRIGAITIILIILSVFIGVRFLLISVEISEFSTACALLENGLLDIAREHTIRSVEYISEEVTWLSCILQERDANISLVTTFYMLIFSILLTLISWNMDKLKKKN